MRKLLICAVLSALPCAGFAQHYLPWNSDIDVNGIYLGSVYTKAQVEAKLGAPTNYRSNTSEFGLNETYDYSNNQFYFSDNGIFNGFYIDTPNFVVYTAKSGGIKVGDNVSRIAAIGMGTPELQSDGDFSIPSGDDRFTVGQSDGKISWISYISPI
jgi:hypothetical protein